MDAVQTRIDAFAERHQRAYPSAVRCLLADRAQLTTYLRFPAEHHHRIRHSNFIERTFGETRRRMKVIGRLPGRPAACRWSGRCWTGQVVAGGASPQTPTAVRLLQDLGRQLLSPPTLEEVVDQAIAAAA